MSDDPAEERFRLIRATRQRLEGLSRAGLDMIRMPDLPPASALVRPAPPARPVAPAAAKIPPPAIQATPAAAPPTTAPSRIAQTAALPAVSASLFGESHFDSAALPGPARGDALAVLASEVSGCVRCPQLAATRTQTVFGTGHPSARLFFVGEAPGADEDRTGLPFVGRAGMLLTDMITKGMGLTRDEVYIANVLKSRPPENRTPLPDEIAHCLPYLERQIDVVRPEFLCLLGKTAASALLETALPMTRLRGKWHRYRGIPAIVTYHPAYLLRNPDAKKDAWDDLKMLMQAMGIARKS